MTPAVGKGHSPVVRNETAPAVVDGTYRTAPTISLRVTYVVAAKAASVVVLLVFVDRIRTALI
jgi:hypothetical protein